ncbi:MAG: hypothetical protein CSA75_00515, partial [Sorangium cellulosum]
MEALRCQIGIVTFVARASFIAALGITTGLTVASPARAQAVPPPPHTPTDTYPPESTRMKLVLGGLGTTAAFYGIAQPFAYAYEDTPGNKDLRIPVVGPWMALSNTRCANHEPDCSTFWLWTRGILTTLDGLGQAGGLLIALEGIFLQSSEDQPGTKPAPKRKAPRDQDRPKDEPPPRNLFLAPAPMGV